MESNASRSSLAGCRRTFLYRARRGLWATALQSERHGHSTAKGRAPSCLMDHGNRIRFFVMHHLSLPRPRHRLPHPRHRLPHPLHACSPLRNSGEREAVRMDPTVCRRAGARGGGPKSPPTHSLRAHPRRRRSENEETKMCEGKRVRRIRGLVRVPRRGLLRRGLWARPRTAPGQRA